MTISRFKGTPLDNDLEIVDLLIDGISLKSIAMTFKMPLRKVRDIHNRHFLVEDGGHWLSEEEAGELTTVRCKQCGKGIEMNKLMEAKKYVHFCSRLCITIGLRYSPMLGQKAYFMAKKGGKWKDIAWDLGYQKTETALRAAKEFANKNDLTWPLKDDRKGNKSLKKI